MINIQGAGMSVQTDILDKLFRGLLPLALTLGTLYFAEEQESQSDESHGAADRWRRSARSSGSSDAR